MNLSSLKSFAPEVRRQLMEAVGRKLDFVLTGDTADLRAAVAQVERLRSQAEADRKGLIEQVAYTWFNRLAALRFIDAHPGWHPFRARVVTAAVGETQPELLKLTRAGALPAELESFTDPKRLNDLLDGHLPSPDPQGEVYRHLILAACRYYHDLMPFLFEALDDETELLLPDDLLTEHSIAHGFRTEISDEDCSEVELIGWFYQFYISEKKDQVMARKSAVPSEDIPAVTQLFTPHWIVRYLVENSLGRLWLHSRPGSRLREHMPYYVDEPDGQTLADSLTVARPEEIRLLDPASGSGHMLTYSFDLLYRIYEEEGHAPSEIPSLILQHNIYGLDICPRAAQLAQFALVCKAREKSRTAFRNPIQPHVMCLVDVYIFPEELKEYLELHNLQELFSERVMRQVHQFRENMSIFGSLIQPVLTVQEITELHSRLAMVVVNVGSSLEHVHKKVLNSLKQAEMLCQRYHAVVANPPYMGVRQMNGIMKAFGAEKYPSSKSDLFAMFIERGLTLAVESGYAGLVTMHSWMFLSSFEQLRTLLVSEKTIVSMAHLGAHGFDSIGGEVVQTTSFVIENSAAPEHIGIYYRLTSVNCETDKAALLIQALSDKKSPVRYSLATSEFTKIPGKIIAYWMSQRLRSIFANFPSLSSISRPRQGATTSDNNRFLRLWHEVSINQVNFTALSLETAKQSLATWFPYNKGGNSRKWSGNQDYVINYRNDGEDIKAFHDVLNLTSPGGRLKNQEYYFKSCVSWSKVAGGNFAVRFFPDGFIFDVAGSAVFFDTRESSIYFCGLLNSGVIETFLKTISPTINFEAEHLAVLPVPAGYNSMSQFISTASVVNECISVACSDWDNFETSWGFRNQPLLRQELKGTTLEVTCQNWEAQCIAAIRRMQALEAENNGLFITAYGLEGELKPEVPEEQITLARPDRRKDMAAFLSYAIGCMMGRYSLDAPGLILASAGDTLEQYLAKVGKPLDQLTFTPDEDGIIPVLDGEWFEDDIVARTRDFIRATFGDATLETNLHFIEESLGKDLRKYFLTDFYRDHLQTYKKRPIYWMFQSPKKGFSALVYLHRYTKDTPNRLLSSYLRDFLHKLRAHLEHLDHLMASESTPAREVTKARKENEQYKKTLRECEDWERDVLLPLAQKRIELDLDDGVKVNYLKLGEALATIPGLAAKEDD